MSHSHTCHLLVSDLLSTALLLGVGGGMKQMGSKILMFNCDSSASDSWRVTRYGVELVVCRE